MTGKNLAKLAEEVPADKLTAKVRNTKTGIVLVALGVFAAFGSFYISMQLVLGGGGIDKWGVVLAITPFFGGILLAVVGATVWSGEVVTAAFRDILDAVRGVIRSLRGMNGHTEPRE